MDRQRTKQFYPAGFPYIPKERSPVMSWSIFATGQKKAVLARIKEQAASARRNTGPVQIAQVDAVEALLSAEVSAECTVYNESKPVGYEIQAHGHADKNTRNFEIKFSSIELAIDEPAPVAAPAATEAAPAQS